MSSISLPDISDDEQRTLNMLLARLAAKTPRNLLRASYYDGKRAIRQVGTVIPPQYYKLGIVLGWSAKAVDILARRCNLDGFKWPDGDLDSIGYQEVWDGNNFGSEISSAITSALIHGTSFLVNTTGDPATGEPAGLIHVKDAMSATGEWSERTRSLTSLLSITGCDDEGEVSALSLYLDGETITAERDGAKWSVSRLTHPWGVPAEPLVYKPRIGRPFGSARINNAVMSLHDQALRTVIRMEGHMDTYSYPEFWLLGADESIFKNPDGSQKAIWQTMLARIKGVPDDEDAENPRADVKQFAASSPEPHLAHLNALAKMFARETSLPDVSVAITDLANPTSAEAINAGSNELIAEAEGVTDDCAPRLRAVLNRALAMQNNLEEVPAEWRSIMPKFRPPQFESRAAQADAGMKQLTAIPWLADTDIGLELLGLDESQITRALAAKRRMGGSAALRAITDAAAAQASAPAMDAAAAPDDAAAAAALKAKFDALGAAIRSGVEPESAARLLGLEGLSFTGAVPVSLRVPEAAAQSLEQTP